MENNRLDVQKIEEQQERRLREGLKDHQMQRISMSMLKPAAVLIPLVWRDNEWQVLFEIRAGGIVQGGEICFPGGSLEEKETPAEAAVRETQEELLLEGENIERICPMHETIGPGGRKISSFLGILHDYRDTWERDEVERTFLLPLSWFRNHQPELHEGRMKTEVGEDFPLNKLCGGKTYPFQEVRRTFCFYDTPEGLLWGLTAQLMQAALPILLQVLDPVPGACAPEGAEQRTFQPDCSRQMTEDYSSG